MIIVSWNVAGLLHDCLQAVFSPEVMGHLCLEVIVVDNASVDDSVRVAQSHQGVRVVHSKRNFGYGRANNIGFRLAHGKYLLVLNPDTVPLPGSLAALVSFAEHDPRAAIVAPRLLNPNGTVQRSAFRFPTLLMALIDLFPPPKLIPGRLRERLIKSTVNGRYPNELKSQRPIRIDHPLGAVMLLRREAVEQLGGFDEQLFMYSEEVDLALRFKRSGWECWQVPAARVVHLGGQSTKQMPDRMFRELWRSRLYIYEKHRSLVSGLALRVLLMVAQIKELFVSFVQHVFSRQSRNEADARRKRASSILRLALGLRT